MKLLEGIQLHELILMILGLILGLTLIFIFLYTALQSKPNLKLLYGFIAPIVMIGYPSFQGHEFNDKIAETDLLVQKVISNPSDTAIQNQLKAKLETLPASRCKTSSDAMAVIANAQAALGSYEAATKTIEKAKVINDKNTNVLESETDIKNLWQTQKDYEQRIKYLEGLLKKLEAEPKNTLVLDSIEKHLSMMNQKTTNRGIHLDNHQIVTVARASAILGEKENAVALNKEVLKVSPKDKEATKLREEIRNKEFDNKYKTRVKPPKKLQIPTPQATNDIKNKPQSVPAPAPVFQDTQIRALRLIPRNIENFNIWNKDQ